MSRLIEAVAQELRYAVRTLRKSPGFSTIAVLSVALGIGVNTAMFSVVNAVLLRTVPFPDPERIVRLVRQHTGGDVAIPEYQLVTEHGRVFSSIAAYRGGGERRLEARGVQTWVTALTVSTDFLRTLRMQPLVGREFMVDETRTGGPQAVIISDGVWRSSFGADAGVLGQTITLNNTAFTIVGVLPADFWFPQPVDVLVPLRPTRG